MNYASTLGASAARLLAWFFGTLYKCRLIGGSVTLQYAVPLRIRNGKSPLGRCCRSDDRHLYLVAK